VNDSDLKPRTSNKLVLVADEDARTARLLARMLRDDGYTVELVLDGAAALARLTRSPVPDALVTDFHMPHADGAAVARYAQSRRSGLPIFLVTGYPELVHELERSLDPPARVFTKPLDYDAFQAELARSIVTGPQGTPQQGPIQA
jgi:two-component system response regulator MprA